MSNSAEVIIIIRPSFKKFCGTDACRAALFNHFLYWIARKAQEQPEDKVKRGDIYWYGSAEQICDEGLDNSWSVNKVRKEIDALVDAGLVGQRHNPLKKWDRTMHYFIGEEQGKVIREQCEKHNICLADLGLTDTVLHLLNLVNAFTKKGNSNCQISEMDLPNLADPSTKNGEAIPKVSTKISSKDNNKETAPEPGKRSASFDLFMTHISTELRDLDHEEENKEQGWEIFNAAKEKKVSQADFKRKADEALKEARSVELDKIYSCGYQDRTQYYFWYLCLLLHVPFKQLAHS